MTEVLEQKNGAILVHNPALNIAVLMGESEHKFLGSLDETGGKPWRITNIDGHIIVNYGEGWK